MRKLNRNNLITTFFFLYQNSVATYDKEARVCFEAICGGGRCVISVEGLV